MNMFTLSMETDNAAFEASDREEVARILREVIAELELGAWHGKCRDSNGNTVGGFEFGEVDA